MCVCVCVCVRAHTRACVRVCVRGACVCVDGRWFTWVVRVGTIKDLKAPFPVLKAGHVDHLLVHI